MILNCIICIAFSQSSILVNGLDKFDYSHGEPAPKFLTILRVLQVNEQVNYDMHLTLKQYDITSIAFAFLCLD